MRRGRADRFERLADKSWHNWEAAVTPPRIAQLLRREHRAVVRMVKAYKELCRPHDTDRCVEWQVAWHCIENTCDDILARLEERAR